MAGEVEGEVGARLQAAEDRAREAEAMMVQVRHEPQESSLSNCSSSLIFFIGPHFFW